MTSITYSTYVFLWFKLFQSYKLKVTKACAFRDTKVTENDNKGNLHTLSNHELPL